MNHKYLEAYAQDKQERNERRIKREREYLDQALAGCSSPLLTWFGVVIGFCMFIVAVAVIFGGKQ